MTETIDEKVLTEIEKALGTDHIEGVIIIKKSFIPKRTQNLIKGIADYIRSRGYDSLTKEDDQEYSISLILKPF